MDFKYIGLILSKRDIAEVDRFYSIYTKEKGKITLIGRGVRNPNAKLAGNLEPVTLSEIFVAKSRGRGKITGAISVNHFPRIKSDWLLISKVFWVWGIVDRMSPEEEKDERVFSLLLAFLEILEQEELSSQELDVITLGFVFKFLDFSGYRMEVEKCVRCGGRLISGENYLNASGGGISCRSCSSQSGRQLKVSDQAIKIVRLYLRNEIKNFKKIKVQEKDVANLKNILKDSLRWIIE